MTIGGGLDTLKNLLGWVADNAGKVLLVVSPVLGLLFYGAEMLTWAVDGLTDAEAILAEINAAGTASYWSGLGTWFGYADYLFPVHEVFAMIGIYISLRGLCTTLRTIKGWIPGLG